MATSGNISVEIFDTQKVIDKAFRRAKIPAQVVTSENIQIATDALYLLCSQLVDEGLTLWTTERILIGGTVNLAGITMPPGTLRILNSNYRTVTRWDGTLTSSDGGTGDLADDGDLYTACTQNAPNGTIMADFGSGSEQLVTTVAICANGDQWLAPAWEWSFDGATWVEALAVDQQLFLDKQFYWYDIDGSTGARYFRLRETGGGTIDVREIVFGWMPYAVQMGKLNRDQYSNYTDKTFPGLAYQFWYDRGDIAGGTMRVWPVINDKFAHFEVWRHRQIMDPGTMTQQIEVPQSWLNSITWNLAAILADEIVEAPEGRAAYCSQKATESRNVTWSRETDGGPVNLIPNINPYTA